MLFIFKTLIEERIIVDCKVLVKVIQIELGRRIHIDCPVATWLVPLCILHKDLR